MNAPPPGDGDGCLPGTYLDSVTGPDHILTEKGEVQKLNALLCESIWSQAVWTSLHQCNSFTAYKNVCPETF